jgi:hypothetical protein
MTTLKIYGYSDDLINLIEVESNKVVNVEGNGLVGADYGFPDAGYEFNAGNVTSHAGVQFAGTLRVTCGEDSADVHAIYGRDGSWCFAVQASESYKKPIAWPSDQPIPWPVERTYGQDGPYSETVTFTLPGPATVKWIAT